MSKYDKETKFFWLQLKEDFFDDDAIQWLEEQKPNGRDYAYFYLKLCLKSLRTNGVLIRNVGEILIPYDNRKLAELTKMDFDTVTVAMELLKKIGLVKILENGEIYINQVEKLVGEKSLGAFKKQQQRLLSGHKEDKCPPKIEKEIEINKEKDKYNSLVEIYNFNCPNLPKVQKITEKRKRTINKFLKEYTKEQFIEICKIANNNDFLMGKNDRGWKADFDFLIRVDKATSILEGKYGNITQNENNVKATKVGKGAIQLGV